ncbi:hypothetical protein V2J09_002727 [Rumex salicifolius]
MELQSEKWRIRCKSELRQASGFTIRKVLDGISSNLDPNDTRRFIHIGHGDPSAYPCFRPATAAVDAVSAALHSASFNCYSPSAGILAARQAIAKDLSRDLPYNLSHNDVYMTVGCHNSIEVALGVLATPDANILIPRPGYPTYDSQAESCKIQARHYRLIPEKEWEIDLDSIEALADENTVAIVVINPGNPCGNVYTHDHLQKITECIERFLLLSPDPVTFIQGAIPQLLEETKEDFFLRVLDTLSKDVDICWEKLKEIPCISCPYKPQGGMSLVAKLDLSMMEQIEDDLDFCNKLAKEESVLVLPGFAVGMRNWLRISFAIEPELLEEALGRIKAFCQRHLKTQQ